MNMEYYLAIDLEATCCDDNTFPRNEMETIEIGAVMVCKRTLLSVDEFQTFVAPVRNPVLTKFCIQLTGISQSQVDEAPGFKNALHNLMNWAQSFPGFTFCSWGDYDRKQIRSDCEFHGLPFPLGERHINLKAEFASIRGLRKKMGVQEALHAVGLKFIGSHHRGIDDARNIASLIPYIYSPEAGG
ncbi:exonuclease [Planctopirus hydrillae]|uniref:Exonuclease n=2 Tax=Planctopirus hydrillae TaxID=1841610 RepID=A0A1C3EKA5_9PLAN|nr:exonuclease [Planctopirus hydrillae]